VANCDQLAQLAGLIAVCGLFTFGLFVAVPAVRHDPAQSSLLRPTLRDIRWVAFAITIAGMLCVLIVQTGRSIDGTMLAWPGFSGAWEVVFEWDLVNYLRKLQDVAP
jgi:hypothetical protein